MFLNTFAINKEWTIICRCQDIQTRNFQLVKSISQLDPLQSWIRHTQFNKYSLETEPANMNKFLGWLGEPDNFRSGINILDPV